MVAGARRVAQWKAAVAPWELSRFDTDAADRRAVPVNELGRGVQYDVGAQLDGPAEIGRGERVVHHERNARFVCDRRESAQIRNDARRVADRFYEKKLRFGADRRASRVWVLGRDEGRVDSHAFDRHAELSYRAAV